MSARTAMPPLLLILPLLLLSSAEPVIKYLHCLSEIQTRFASTDIVSEIENVDSEPRKVTFTAQLPPHAFIRSFYFDRDGKITYGTIKEKERADEEFAKAEQGGKTAARLRESNSKTFELEVSLAPLAHISFNLTYQEILEKTSYVYKHAVLVKASLPIKDLQINVLIADKYNFSTLHVPEFNGGLSELPNAELLQRPIDPRVVLQAAGDQSGNLAYISFEPKETVTNGELVVLYNTSLPAGQDEIQVVDGFFVHQFSPPEDLRRGNKTVVFVLDKSGSMKGRKIEQVKDAMAAILGELQPDDLFNVVLFDRNVVSWRPQPVKAEGDVRAEALEFVKSVKAGGGTNIGSALTAGLQMLSAAELENPSFLSMLVFLTDGKPTVGKKTEGDILDQIAVDSKSYSIHSISFGKNADYGLMKTISAKHRGIAKRIFENAESDIQIQGFYNEVAIPLMKDVRVRYLDGSVDVASVVSADDNRMVFAGGELLNVGKVNPDSEKDLNSIATQIEASVDEGPSVVTKKVTPSSTCVEENLLQQLDSPEFREIQVCGKTNTIGNFIERMWAQQTILKNERILETEATTAEEKANVAARIAQLGLQFGLVTSQTSMVVVLEGEQRKLRETDVEEDGEEEESAESEKQLQRTELGDEFRIPFDSKKVVYPDECSLELFVFVDDLWPRQINRIRARRFAADVVAHLPPLVDAVPGALVANRSLVLDDGDERELFRRVRDFPDKRHAVLLLSESPSTRPLQYLQALRPGLTLLAVASPFHIYTSEQKALLKEIEGVTVLESPKLEDLLGLFKC